LPALPPESSWIAPSGWLGFPAAGATADLASLSATPAAWAVAPAACTAATRCATAAACPAGAAHRRRPSPWPDPRRFHLRRAQHHGLLEIRLLAGGGSRGGLADELQLVLAQLDDVVVLQEVLLDGVAVHHRAVRAAEVLEERVVQDRDDDGVLAGDREVVDLDVVVSLRPIVVRSFVKGISLRTSPSILSISFAIAEPWERLF